MRVVIDRFEGPYAVCEKENREMMNIERVKLPKAAKEDTVLIINSNDIQIDFNEIDNMHRKIKNLLIKKI